MTNHVLWTVLRSGGEYTVEHVAALRRNLLKTSPGWELGLVTDLHAELLTLGTGEIVADRIVTPRANRHYPGWWMKMNLFNTGTHWMEGDILYCDLDTVLIGDITPLWDAGGTIMLRDFYRLGDYFGSGLMRLTAPERNVVWKEWNRDADVAMMAIANVPGGDQAFLETVAGFTARRWQDVMPGAVCSYKVHIRDREPNPATAHGLPPEIQVRVPPEGTRVVCHHGFPRPWQVDAQWIRDARA